jgi:hypothetical protein
MSKVLDCIQMVIFKMFYFKYRNKNKVYKMCSKMPGIAVAQFRAFFYTTGNFVRGYLATTASFEAQYLRSV